MTGRLRRILRRAEITGTTAPVVQPEDGIEVERTRPCPHCRAPVSRGATVCHHCERDLTPVMSPGQFAVQFGTFNKPQDETESSDNLDHQ